MWGSVPGKYFASQVEEVVFLRRNLFPIPTNRSGRTFVNETATKNELVITILARVDDPKNLRLLEAILVNDNSPSL